MKKVETSSTKVNYTSIFTLLKGIPFKIEAKKKRNSSQSSQRRIQNKKSFKLRKS
jgi:hypothetical protein